MKKTNQKSKEVLRIYRLSGLDSYIKCVCSTGSPLEQLSTKALSFILTHSQDAIKSSTVVGFIIAIILKSRYQEK